MVYKTIVCGVTGSAHGQKAALEAARLAAENQAALVYVYAVDMEFLQGGITVELPRRDVERSLKKLGENILNHAEEIAKTQGVTPKKVVRVGPVMEVLKQVVGEEKADLLVLGHEKRTVFEKALLKGDVEDHVGELRQQTGADVTVVR